MQKIYTIPAKEGFARADGCPMCRIYEKIEGEAIDTILGASMMEPDIRKKTNELGFCGAHYKKMFGAKNRLGLALMMESHLDEISHAVSKKGVFSSGGVCDAQCEFLEKLSHSCYICEDIDYTIVRIAQTVCILWEEDREFRADFEKQPFFCLPHYKMILECRKKFVSKRNQDDFFKSISEIEKAYISKMSEDVSWFCKKFDYRYENEPWKDSKDAVERCIDFLSGK